MKRRSSKGECKRLSEKISTTIEISYSLKFNSWLEDGLSGGVSLVTMVLYQGHPTDPFGGISVRKTCNRLKFSVREMSSRAFLINAFCFRRDKNDILGTKIGQLGFSERQ